jgi:hypothetical protein
MDPKRTAYGQEARMKQVGWDDYGNRGTAGVETRHCTFLASSTAIDFADVAVAPFVGRKQKADASQFQAEDLGTNALRSKPALPILEQDISLDMQRS